jgi:hypothetical protein
MKVLCPKQYDATWWELHRGRPSGSNFKKIITPARADFSKQAIEYVYELVAELYDPQYGIVEDYVSAAMLNGTIMEPESRRFYKLEANCDDVYEVGICESDCGRFICSPDAMVGDEGVLELKNPSYRMQVKYLDEGVLPDEYKVQCHGHILVTKRNWCDFLSYVPRLPPLLIRVMPDEFTVKLAEALDKFWKIYTEVRSKIEASGDPVATTRAPYESPF